MKQQIVFAVERAKEPKVRMFEALYQVRAFLIPTVLRGSSGGFLMRGEKGGPLPLGNFSRVSVSTLMEKIN